MAFSFDNKRYDAHSCKGHAKGSRRIKWREWRRTKRISSFPRPPLCFFFRILFLLSHPLHFIRLLRRLCKGLPRNTGAKQLITARTRDRTTVTTARRVFFYVLLNSSMRSKRFCGVGEQRKTEARDFRCFSGAKNGARAKKRKKGVGEGKRRNLPSPPPLSSFWLSHHFSRGQNTENPVSLSLLPNPTETLATQAS